MLLLNEMVLVILLEIELTNAQELEHEQEDPSIKIAFAESAFQVASIEHP